MATGPGSFDPASFDQGSFDLQAHRGGMGLTVENTLPAFARALILGVTTLECDVNVSLDGVPMVTHDRVVDPAKCRDTAPAEPGDPDFPYAGRFVSRLTSAQLRTLDCGSQTRPELPTQEAAPGALMPLFTEVLDLAVSAGVRVNVEAKFEATHPAEVAPRESFVSALVGAVVESGTADWVSVQSFDWAVLRMVGEAEPRLRRYALTSARSLEIGMVGPSPWLGGLDIDTFVDVDSLDVDGPDLGGRAGSGLVDAVAAMGFDAVSPSYDPFVTHSLVERAHESGVLVVPYTVDDTDEMARMIDLGVDGFITNFPDRAREVMARKGLRLPACDGQPGGGAGS